MVFEYLQNLMLSAPSELSLLIELGVMLIVATFLGFLMKMLKQPLILAYIITGILIGPLVLGLVKDDWLILSLSQIGIAFLIFTAGLEIKFKKLKEVGKVSILGGLTQIIVLFIIAFFISLALGYSGKIPVYIGLIVAFSSTMIVVKLLSDRDELDSLHGRIIIGILVLQDFIAIIALSILSSNLSSNEILILLGKAGIFIFLAFILTKLINPIFKSAAKSTEFLLLISISFLFLFIIGSSLAGLSLIIGAFAAGVVLANSDYKTEIENRISGLREFFSLIFFVALGMQLRIIPSGYLFLLFVLMGLIILIKPVVAMFIIRIYGYEKKTAFLTGNALAQTSEFSLIIATLGLSSGQIDSGLFSTLALLTVLTMYFTTYLINYEKAVYRLFGWILNPLNKFKSNKENFEREFEPEVIIFGCHRMGSLFLKEFERERRKVMVVDYNPEIIKPLNEKAIPCIYGDFINEEVFEKINFSKTDFVVSTIADAEDNLLLIKKIKKLNPKIMVFIVAKRISEAKALYSAGADYVILPMIIGGQKGYNLMKKIANNRALLKEMKREHMRYLDSVHHILY